MPILGITASSIAGSQYWLAALDAGADYNFGEGIAVADSGNIYAIANTYNDIDFYSEPHIIKISPTGTIEWQRSLGTAVDDRGYNITVDSSENVYVVISETTNSRGYVAKYNSSGTIQWQRKLTLSPAVLAYGIAVDSSDNVYVTGLITVSATVNVYLIKYNSSGTLQWQRRIVTSGNSGGYALAIDSADNIYVTGQSTIDTTNAVFIAKYDSSGTIQWQRTLDSDSSDEIPRSITIDTSDNIYVTGLTSISGTQAVIITKYNSSGTLQWQRTLNASGTDGSYGITVDSSDNIYITGDSSDAILIAKYDSSGTIQWQRTLSSSNDESGLEIAFNNNIIYGIGYNYNGGTNEEFTIIFKLPSDGSLTGTYTVNGVSFTYAASSLTDAAGALTGATSTYTEASASITDAAGDLTDAAGSLTIEKTNV